VTLKVQSFLAFLSKKEKLDGRNYETKKASLIKEGPLWSGETLEGPLEGTGLLPFSILLIA